MKHMTTDTKVIYHKQTRIYKTHGLAFLWYIHVTITMNVHAIINRYMQSPTNCLWS